MYAVYEVKDRKGGLTPTVLIVSTDTLTDARKRAYALIWKEHMRQRGIDGTLMRKGIFRSTERIGKVIWCPKCNRILWNDGKEWYTLMKNGRLGKKVH